MIIDNFDYIKELLNFPDEKSFYRVLVLKRKKDNPGMTRHMKQIRFYDIRSVKEYEERKESITRECKLHNARAYIDLNVKDMEKVALLVLKKTAELIYEKQYEAVARVYDHACGNAPTKDKMWMLDVDTCDPQTLLLIESQLSSLDVPILQTIKTMNGCHIIVKPFPCNKFNPIDDVMLMKQCTTLLYTCVDNK